MSIITLTGASAVGKSSIMKLLVERGIAGLMRSVTSRPPRPSDMPGEFEYLDPEVLPLLEKEFLWVHGVHGNSYAVRKQEALRYLESATPGVIALSPQGAERLKEMYPEAVRSFYLLSPDEATLVAHMRGRGDAEETIDRRVADGHAWLLGAQQTAGVYTFIRLSSIEERADAIEASLRENR